MPLSPGPFGLPLVGETLALFRDPYSYGQRRFTQYGDLSKARLLPNCCATLRY